MVKTTRVYYIGGMGREKTESIIEVFGQTYTLPPVGEFIEVPDYVARHMMKRYNFGSRHPFTLNPSFARNVKDGKVRVAEDSTLYVEVERDYSVEELEAMLAEKRGQPQDEQKDVRTSSSTKKRRPEAIPDLSLSEENE